MFHSITILTTLLIALTVRADETETEMFDGELLVAENCFMCHRSDNPTFPDHNRGWVFRRRYTREKWSDNISRMEMLSLKEGYIDEPWPDGAKQAMADYLTVETSVSRSQLEDAGMAHFAAVHFPIALLFVAGIFELVAIACRWPMQRDAIHGLIWLSLLSTAAAVGLGFALIWNMTTLSEDLLDHRNAGLFTLGFVVLALVLREVTIVTGASWARWGYRLSLLLAIAASSAAGHLGGTLLHGEYGPFRTTATPKVASIESTEG